MYTQQYTNGFLKSANVKKTNKTTKTKQQWIPHSLFWSLSQTQIESVSRRGRRPLPHQRMAPFVRPSLLPGHPAPLPGTMAARGTTGERAAQLLWVSQRVLSSAGSGADTWPWETNLQANSTGLCEFWKKVWPGPGRGRGSGRPAWCTAWPRGSTCRPSCRSKAWNRWGSLGWRRQGSRGCLT